MKNNNKYADISLRVTVAHWLEDKKFDDFLYFIKQYEKAIHEIMFFTSNTHTPLKIGAIHDTIPVLTNRIARLQAAGFKTGIDVLTSVGHLSENLDNSLTGCTNITDIHGNVCYGTFCPNDENLVKYNKGMYQLYAHTNPDFIWIDDDVRHFGHGHIEYGCFCEHCLDLFSKKTGTICTREMLCDAFNDNNSDISAKWRRMWIEHNRDSINRLIKTIEETVHNINPEIQMGYMTCEDAFGDIDYESICTILAGKNQTAIKWRPGGGFYNEETPMLMVEKAHRMGRQIALLPDSVDFIQSEIENFPYALLRKSERITNLEAAVYLAVGCTGISYNLMSEDPMKDYERYFIGIEEKQAFYDLMSNTLRNSSCKGISWVWGKDTCFDSNNTGCEWPRNIKWTRNDEHLTIGLPVDYAPLNSESSVCIVMGNDILSATHNEIMLLLSKGVYIDLKTLNHLNRLGYGAFTGFKCDESRDKDCIEVFTDHSINGDYAGRKRDCRQSFWKHDAAILIPNDKKAHSLACLKNYMNEKICDCTMGIYENTLGGRICVAGYFPMTLIYSVAKTTQLKSVFRWLSRDSFDGFVASYHRANIWVNRTMNNTLAVTILNNSFDKANEMKIALKTKSNRIKMVDLAMQSQEIVSTNADENYKYYTLPCINGWDICFLVEV